MIVSVLAACFVLISMGGISAVEVSSVQNIPTVDAATSSAYNKYLVSSKNCQASNSLIKSKSAAITKGTTDPYKKGAKIFTWVRDNLRYTWYSNTRYGAVKTLQLRQGNCVDHAHLIVALSRAAGIPAKYVHAKVRFSSGRVSGHVWAELYVNKKWVKADATSSRNSFGVIRSWSSGSIKGTYSSLPF